MSDDLKDAVPVLFARTQAGEVRWRPTDERNAVSVTVKDASLVLVNDDLEVARTVGERLQSQVSGARASAVSALLLPKGIVLQLRSAEGKTVDSYRVLAGDAEQYVPMKTLWALAYDEAYKVTDTFKALKNALDSDDPLGSTIW